MLRNIQFHCILLFVESTFYSFVFLFQKNNNIGIQGTSASIVPQFLSPNAQSIHFLKIRYFLCLKNLYIYTHRCYYDIRGTWDKL